MTKGYERAIALTERVKVGSYYTDGKCLGQIHKVASLGHILIEVVEGGESIIYGYGISTLTVSALSSSTGSPLWLSPRRRRE